jgi:RNA polymerase subunit RPABC4/transcription elongation factor Spt4
MAKYQCRKCGRIIEPEGKGCPCGESWGSLRIISSFEQEELKRKEHYRQEQE